MKHCYTTLGDTCNYLILYDDFYLIEQNTVVLLDIRTYCNFYIFQNCA